MRFFEWMFGKKATEPQVTQRYKLITDSGEGFYTFDGKLYHSDIIRSCIRPKARATGKLMAQHIRDGANGFQTWPNANIKLLLEEPNPLMSGQMMREKMATQLELNNNAFAIIKRDPVYYEPTEIYPVPAVQVDMLEGPYGDMYLKFYFPDGKQMVVPYVDVIHLRQDFNNHNLFGDHPGPALTALMEVVSTTDQGIMKAVKNGALIKWIMKFKSVLKQEDIDLQVEDFGKNYMNVEKAGGVAPTDPRYDLEQVKNQNYVPDHQQNKNTIERIYNFFNTNEKIVQSSYNEDEWNSYYESVVEPVALQLANEFTRKLFSRHERSHGNKIVFESLNLTYASMKTKLGLVDLVDRGIMSPNEMRRVFNMAPAEHGDEFVRRLDTASVEDGKEIEEDEGGDDDGQDGDSGADDHEAGNP